MKKTLLYASGLFLAIMALNLSPTIAQEESEISITKERKWYFAGDLYRTLNFQNNVGSNETSINFEPGSRFGFGYYVSPKFSFGFNSGIEGSNKFFALPAAVELRYFFSEENKGLFVFGQGGYQFIRGYSGVFGRTIGNNEVGSLGFGVNFNTYKLKLMPIAQFNYSNFDIRYENTSDTRGRMLGFSVGLRIEY